MNYNPKLIAHFNLERIGKNGGDSQNKSSSKELIIALGVITVLWSRMGTKISDQAMDTDRYRVLGPIAILQIAGYGCLET